MGGKDSDNDGGFPEKVLEQMQAGHDKYMRDEYQDTPTQPSQPNEARETNIFLVFKDFVDTNLSTLAASFKSLPSNLAELQGKMQEQREAHEQEELRIWRRWTGREDSEAAMLAERAVAENGESQSEGDDRRRRNGRAVGMLLHEAMTRHRDMPNEKITALYRDAEAPTLSWSAGTMAKHYQWLSVDWFKRSPYSPIALEDSPDLSNHGGQWREAFEDLINASLDKPMNSYEQFGHRPNFRDVQSTLFGPGLHWMLSLQCRGILPPQLPRLCNSRAGYLPPPELDDTWNDLRDRTNSWSGCWAFMGDVRDLQNEVATPPNPEHVSDYEEPSVTEQDVYDAHHHIDDAEQQLQLHRTGKLYDQRVSDEQSSLPLYHDREERAKIDAWFRNQQRLDVLDDLDDLKESEAALHRRLEDLEDSERDEIQDAGKRGRLNDLRERLEQERDALGLDDDDEADDDDYDDNMGYTCPYRPGPEPDNSGNHPLQDYQMQLMLLEQQNKQRLIIARREQEHQEEQELLKQKRAAESKSPIDSQRNLIAERKVDVLSSLTTTHTTRLADGTVTTRVVLKQRFADGREEEEEKVHTYQDPARQQAQAPADGGSDGKGKKRSGGWFWT